MYTFICKPSISKKFIILIAFQMNYGFIHMKNATKFLNCISLTNYETNSFEQFLVRSQSYTAIKLLHKHRNSPTYELYLLVVNRTVCLTRDVYHPWLCFIACESKKLPKFPEFILILHFCAQFYCIIWFLKWMVVQKLCTIYT